MSDFVCVNWKILINLSILLFNQLAYIRMVLLHTSQELTYPIAWPSVLRKKKKKKNGAKMLFLYDFFDLFVYVVGKFVLRAC